MFRYLSIDFHADFCIGLPQRGLINQRQTGNKTCCVVCISFRSFSEQQTLTVCCVVGDIVSRGSAAYVTVGLNKT